MAHIKTLLQTLKPGVPKRTLLFIAGGVWTFAGGMLLYRGITMLTENLQHVWIKLLFCLIAGSLFYYFIFDKISSKHTSRIISLTHSRPCAFSFFNWRSYLMMALMISMGVALRASGIVPMEYLSLLYITMGIPLILSAIRFYRNGFDFRNNP